MTGADHGRRVLFFGTYDERSHPRVRVLREGFVAAGDLVDVCNVPLGFDTAARVRLARQPWRLPFFVGRLVVAWVRLALAARGLPQPDLVVVGYLGQFDVHLARLLFRAPIALDQMVTLGDTVRDRDVGGGRMATALDAVDRWAANGVSVVVVDTEEHAALLAPEYRSRAVVIPVGAPQEWWAPPAPHDDEVLRVVFYGLFTPLQGAPTVGAAMARLTGDPVRFTIAGDGQDRPATRAAAGTADAVEWIDWVEAEDLPALVAEHDVCLGIFGTGPKAARVVPNKVFQGAAAGCAIVTGDTPPQREALGDDAVFVPVGDADALARALRDLAGDRDRLDRLRTAAHARATSRWSPERLVAPLRARVFGDPG